MIEAITEQKRAKTELLGGLDQVATDRDAIPASNTSSISNALLGRKSGHGFYTYSQPRHRSC